MFTLTCLICGLLYNITCHNNVLRSEKW